MAGIGPQPKDASQRARKTAPQRGEWIDLEPLTEPCLPELPDLGTEWNARTQRKWAAWQMDPVAAVTLADLNDATELALLYEWAVREGTAASWNTLKSWMEQYGLTPEGRKKLRFRVVAPKQNTPLASVVAMPSRRPKG
jgi:hypothetical protein